MGWWGTGWSDRARYRIDLLLSKGSASAIGWVVVLAVALAVLGGLAFWALGVSFGDRSGPIESFYQAFLIAIGKGGIVDADWTSRAVSFVFVFAGVFLTGSLVGVLVAAVNRRLDELRRGLGRILETGHTVVLGWSPRLMPVIDELLLEDPHARVVVLADRDKQAMEDEFRSRASKSDRDRVVFRSGDPTRRSELERVAVQRARSVIVLSHGSFVDAAAVRRALMAHSVEPDESHVVTELVNLRVAASLGAADETVGAVTVGEVVADVLAQAVRSSGLGRVFADILSFGGVEIHLAPEGLGLGRSFHELASSPMSVRVLGWVTAGGTVELVPPPTTLVPPGARLVVIAPDPPAALDMKPGGPHLGDLAFDEPEVTSVLVLGWNDIGEGLVDRLARYLTPRSMVTVLADREMLPTGLPEWRWDLRGGSRHTKHDPTEVLGAIRTAAADVVVVLGYTDRMSESEADAMTLLSLAMLERARRDGRVTGTRFVAQLHDHGAADMALETCVGDFVVTDAFVSRMLVHSARDRAMPAIHRELFDATGPVLDIVHPVGDAHRFDSLVAAVADFGMSLVGVLRSGLVRFDIGPDDLVTNTDSLVVARRPHVGDVKVRVEAAGTEDRSA